MIEGSSEFARQPEEECNSPKFSASSFKIENQRIQFLPWKQAKHLNEDVDVNGV